MGERGISGRGDAAVSDEDEAVPGRARMSRRRLLQGTLLAGAALGTGAWRWPEGSPSRPPGSWHPRKPGSLPYPDLPSGTDTIPQVEHIVVLMMENHSYDNKLGLLCRRGADGFRVDSHGRPR